MPEMNWILSLALNIKGRHLFYWIMFKVYILVFLIKNVYLETSKSVILRNLSK